MTARIIGIDEVGRGCWAGPVVAAAFSPNGALPRGIRDSKKLSAVRRAELYAELTHGHAWAIGVASVEEIDRINILQATFLAMRRAFDQLPHLADAEVIVDGNRDPGLTTAYRVSTLVKADDKVEEVAAASIIAKHWRDTHLQELDRRYPGYGFAKHAGYGVPVHIRALSEMGPCAEHRRSFAPIKALLATAAS